MLDVTIDIVPFGVEQDRQKLFRLKIANISAARKHRKDDLADYTVVFEGNGQERRAYVQDFERSRGAAELVMEAIGQVFGYDRIGGKR